MLTLRFCRTALTALLTTSFAATFVATGLTSPRVASAAGPPPTLFTATNAGAAALARLSTTKTAIR